ncbi:hypothetical protein F4553_000905 [Allocatelliglobosispora scoriae]|uniref:Uncharacterized protein n=1 Tax=Allocatelliglobosispora scoriae TaxID=643052 RepID=A0A841BJY9_9ACTN|nr:hypothetical protein [Allocatelliglobosispora scoriae]MBB5867526.1 hypothetical protein [Allocatelliglobosispora scoriae]
MDLAIVEDPDPDGPPSALRAARLAWAAVADDATHHLVVQDDMELVAGIAQSVRQAAAAMPDQILCLFSEWGSRTAHAVRLGAIEGVSWVPVIDPYIPTTAVLLPAQVARELAVAPAGETVPDDVVLLAYLRERGLVAYVSVPNLAEHRGSASIVGNDTLWGPRHTALYAGRLETVPVLDSTISQQTLVPHVLVWDGLSVALTREAPAEQTRGQWSAIPTYRFLAERGVTVPDLLGWFDTATTDLFQDGEVRTLVADPILFQSWVNHLAYGVAATNVLPDLDTLTKRLSDPVVMEAMRTLIPGMFQRFLPLASVMRLRDIMDDFIRGAMQFGFTVPELLAERAARTAGQS